MITRLLNRRIIIKGLIGNWNTLYNKKEAQGELSRSPEVSGS